MIPETISKYTIPQPDKTAIKQAADRLDSLVKPPGSLGVLEAIARKTAGITGEVFNDISKRCVVIMAADNGVVEEGVAAAPQSVTYTQTLNFTKGITGVAVLAKLFAADLIITDVGINADIDNPMVRNRKIKKSTGNIAKEPAMTYDEAARAVSVGIETAIQAAKDGYKIIGAGEMGIGNTTTSSAVLCALTDLTPEVVTGKGAGLRDDAYRHKIEVVRRALQINKPNSADPIDVLAKVGGLDIAALAGVYLGGAHMRIPVVIDGFISMTAALAATRINPLVKEYIFASHASFELGYMYAARAAGLQPCLNLDMRLGEGSGCPLMFAVMDAACALIKNMATFAEADIHEDYINEVKDADFHIRRL